MGKKLLFLGDSHLRVPRFAADAGLFKPFECRFELVGGATAVGLRHPTSKTQALTVFRAQLYPYNPSIVPIFQIGEVDCGFVIWLRAQKYQESIQTQLKAALTAYRNFLLEIRDAGYYDLIVTSAILPTILDGQLDGQVALLRHEVKASFRERTDLTLKYNEEMRIFCRANKLRFADLTSRFMDLNTLALSDKFRHPNRDDHHLNPTTAGSVWADVILQSFAGGYK